MHTITITGSTRERVVDSGEELIAVLAVIQNDGETVAERRLGFPLDATEDHIRDELAKVLAAFVRDQEIATATQRSEELNTHADDVQANLEGVTIEHE
jgi:hypothetical protein